MSYVLDALQRAEVERNSTRMPGLHTAPAAAQGQAATSRLRKVWWLAAAVAALIALVVTSAALGSKWLARPDLPAAAPAPTTVATPASALPGPAVPVPMATATASTSALATTTATPPAPASAPNQQAQPAAPKRETTQRAARKAAMASQPAASGAAGAKAPAPKPPDAAELPAPKALPAELRQQLPALKLGGASYSDNPAMRLLIVNGQVWSEGSSLTPELKLERIGLASAVFNFKGQPFEVRY